MNRDCFTCRKACGCLRTWMCYENPKEFKDCDDYEPSKKINNDDEL